MIKHLTSINIMFTFEIKIKDMNLLKEKYQDNFDKLNIVLLIIKSRGYFSIQDYRVFVEMGIPTIQMLANNFKTNYFTMRNMVNDGEVSYEDLIISLYNY